MTLKHNQQLPNNHFRKDWQRRVRVYFDQPGRKLRRRNARKSKAAAIAPRPVDKLRPIVRCPTIKYNRRVRAGRGFTLTELKEAGIPRQSARTIGIAVDHRRQNLSMESLTANVERLKAYKARLILFPRKLGQHKKDDASKNQLKEENITRAVHATLPITQAEHEFKEIKKSDMPKPIEGGAYRKLREARADARHAGKREKRAKEKADEAAAAKK